MMMKAKGFDKPIKYIVVGGANLTKTSLVKKTGLSYFESDSLNEENILDVTKWDLSKDVIVIGGKWIREYYTFIYKDIILPLREQYTLIEIQFRELKE